MIEISKLDVKDVGRWVRYNKDTWGPRNGRLKFWNKQYIFVVYSCAGQWDRFHEFTGEATSPEDLDFRE